MTRSLFTLTVTLIFVSISFAPMLAQQTAELPQQLDRIKSGDDHSTATADGGIVASVHPLATEAGVAALEAGGNAVDAAIATAMTLSVVDNFNSGIGGGCFILIRKSDGTIVAIDAREMAPAKADRDMYIRDGKPDTNLSQIGPLAIGVPGAVAGYHQAVRDHGKLGFDKAITHAARHAGEGFIVNNVYSRQLSATQTHLKTLAPNLLHADGTPFKSGERLVQTDLAKTLNRLANDGPDYFYRGEFALKAGDWISKNGGVIEAKDFANYKTVLREPVRTKYRGFEIIGFPPPSSGGVHVAQILNILESFDLKKLNQESPAKMKHVVAEAMKLAFADRAYWLGDPDFVKVPRGLIDKGYAKKLAERIDLNKTIAVKSHGTPPNADSKFFERHTTHIATADAEGNWVAITSTVNTTFGSKVIVPGLGVVMNNQMDDFSIAPGTPNAFGLIGGENNAIAPGKRPLSSMSPTIVLKDGQPVMTIGAAGGPKIITQAVWGIVNHLDLEMPIGQAVAAARVHHQWSPDRLLVETKTPAELQAELTKYGHTIRNSKTVGITQAISFSPKTGLFTGTHDPRTPGEAQGVRK